MIGPQSFGPGMSAATSTATTPGMRARSASRSMRGEAAVRDRRQAERGVQRAGELGQVVDVGRVAGDVQVRRLVRRRMPTRAPLALGAPSSRVSSAQPAAVSSERFTALLSAVAASFGDDVAASRSRRSSALAAERRVAARSRARSGAAGSARPAAGRRRSRACRTSGAKSLRQRGLRRGDASLRSRAGRRSAASACAARLTVAAMPPKARRAAVTRRRRRARSRGRRTPPRCRSRSASRSCRRARWRAMPAAAPRSPARTRRLEPVLHVADVEVGERHAAHARRRGAARCARRAPSAPAPNRRSASRWRRCRPSCRRCGSAATAKRSHTSVERRPARDQRAPGVLERGAGADRQHAVASRRSRFSSSTSPT